MLVLRIVVDGDSVVVVAQRLASSSLLVLGERGRYLLGVMIELEAGS